MGRTSSSPVRRVVAVLVSTAVLGTGLVVGATTAAAAAGEEYSFLAKINSSRQAHGLRPLSMSGDLVSIARSWSDYQGDGKCPGGASICHNPRLSSQASNWRKIGENVGVGGDVTSIQNAFMNSPHHRANILDPDYTQVGIGTVYGKDGRLYVTQDFRQPMNAPSGSTAKKRSPAPAQPPSSAAGGSAPAPRSSAPYAPTAPAAKAQPAPKPSLAAKLRAATAKAEKKRSADDPVSQALSFASTMDLFAR